MPPRLSLSICSMKPSAPWLDCAQVGQPPTLVSKFPLLLSKNHEGSCQAPTLRGFDRSSQCGPSPSTNRQRTGRIGSVASLVLCEGPSGTSPSSLGYVRRQNTEPLFALHQLLLSRSNQ